jgi:alpha/beta superfamily hydrolase
VIELIKIGSILKKAAAVVFIVSALAACGQLEEDSRTFAEAHDSFKTRLTKNTSDQDEIPMPPEGVFDLVYYPTTIGDMAAYLSSDAEDGKKHPLIIWLVGGWSNGIDDFPWSYPDWENDQTGSAFREAGLMMMYPSLRGANGNPGYQESMFGEINDIVSAYHYAASLPYIDADRIYLGGHSTGGTRALLTAAYTDVFRAVISFGPVGDIKKHNQSEFTFDIKDSEECKMRSPIHWLKDIKTPTFIIEGQKGNGQEVKNIERQNKNELIHCFVVDKADHFDVLAPVTNLLARKLFLDIGADCNLSLTSQDLLIAMIQPYDEPMPLMVPFGDISDGIRFLLPANWEGGLLSEQNGYVFCSPYEEDNFWESSYMIMEFFTENETLSYDEFIEIMDIEYVFESRETVVNGNPAFIIEYTEDEEYFNVVAAYQKDGEILLLTFWLPEEFHEKGKALFDQIIKSVELY